MYNSKLTKPLDRQMGQIVNNATNEIQLVELKENYFYVEGFANVGVIITDEGVVVIDTNTSNRLAQEIYNKISQKTDQPIRYIIYTHGHWDHVNSTHIFKEEGTQIIGHENVLDRFYKYKHLNEYNLYLNNIQFQGKLGITSYEFIPPDITFSKEFQFTLGGKTFHIVHGKGETDDHCFIHIPEDDVVYSGDFFVSAFPNIGNPLKVNRYEKEWYEALEKILALKPGILSPGHGRPIFGQQKIKESLEPVIEALRFVHTEVFKCLNEGLSLEEALEDIKLPEHLDKNKYLKPSYGCLEFAIKGTYRRYTGWFDGNPTNLRPGKAKDVAAAILSLIPDHHAILRKCRDLIDEGNYQLALHLADILIDSQDDPEAKKLKKEAVQKCAETTENFIMRNIYDQLLAKL